MLDDPELRARAHRQGRVLRWFAVWLLLPLVVLIWGLVSNPSSAVSIALAVGITYWLVLVVVKLARRSGRRAHARLVRLPKDAPPVLRAIEKSWPEIMRATGLARHDEQSAALDAQRRQTAALAGQGRAKSILSAAQAADPHRHWAIPKVASWELTGVNPIVSVGLLIGQTVTDWTAVAPQLAAAFRVPRVMVAQVPAQIATAEVSIMIVLRDVLSDSREGQ